MRKNSKRVPGTIFYALCRECGRPITNDPAATWQLLANTSDPSFTYVCQICDDALEVESGERTPSASPDGPPLESTRRRECMGCGHTFTAPVILSKYTANLSGEATAYCPKCGNRGVISYPAETH